MIYDIDVRLRYSYDPPAPAGRNLLRLRPMEIPGLQYLIAAEVGASPEAQERGDRGDFFGNAVTELVHRAPAARTDFTLRARVERLAAAPGPDISPPLDRLPGELARLRSIAPDSPHHMTAASPRVPPVAEIAAFAELAVAGAGTVAAAVAALGAALHQAMTFDADATTVDTPAALAFGLRRGVCQDFAHIMLVGLRAVGVPAGYVSGLLRTTPPPGRPRLEGADAMHAWVRAWAGARTGWIEYDPTNACPAGEGHIAVALGRDYDDVAPVQGVLRSSGGGRGSQAVDVVPVDGQDPADVTSRRARRRS